MQPKANRRCETCKHWGFEGEMIPENDHPTTPGTCQNERLMALGSPRLAHQGTECGGWIPLAKPPASVNETGDE